MTSCTQPFDAPLRPLAFALVVAIVVFVSPQHAHAQFGIKWPWSSSAASPATVPANNPNSAVNLPPPPGVFAPQPTAGTITSPQGPLTPIGIDRNPLESTVKVIKGSGTLPNDHGQVWREYDITPYTTAVGGDHPEQLMIDWILRETGTEVWFNEPLGILSATPTSLRVYHTPSMQTVVQGIVEQFVTSTRTKQVMSVKLLTVSSPSWRTKMLAMLTPVDVKSTGIEAWLVSKENAAVLLGTLRERADFKELGSPNQEVLSGQSLRIARTKPRSYTRGIKMRPDAWPGYEMLQGSIDEGFSLEISPLVAVGGKSVDTVIKCHVDQVEKMLPLAVDVPTPAQVQRVQVQVPQMVSWRVHERFQWSVDEVLLLSCGVVASPVPDAKNPLAKLIPIDSSSGRCDALLMLEVRTQLQSPVGRTATSDAPAAVPSATGTAPLAPTASSGATSTSSRPVIRSRF